LVARRTEALQEVAKACADAHKQSGLQDGGRFATIQLDVSDKAQVASLFDKVPKELRDIDILGRPTFSAEVIL
jgi:3-hydroxy acid dehydrogenase/malonic semialdehyde reductase